MPSRFLKVKEGQFASKYTYFSSRIKHHNSARNFRNKRIRPHQMQNGRKGKEQPGNRCNQSAQKAKKLNVNNCPRLPIGKPRILKKKRTLSMEMTIEEMADEMRFRLWESKL